MLNIGSLVVDSLDYILIVDKDYRIVYNTRYDATLNERSKEYDLSDILNKYYFDVYPKLKREESSVVRCIETKQIIIMKHQVYYDYLGRKFVTNNVTFPLMRMGDLVAVVELAMDADEDSRTGDASNKKFDEFVFRLQKDAGLITFETILTEDERMKKAIEQAKMLSTLPNPVLIYGETGTGKELFAQSMINYSGVPKEKVVIQNCAAVPDNLMESILFGTVKGVYTGAENRKGLFEEADGGVLFLDEISTIPYAVQAKFLRVIQDGTFRPLGAAADKHVNVKIICAMNVDPVKAIEDGTFRADLFYRLSSGYIDLLPLRERKDDIKLFIRYYIDYFAQIYSKNIYDVDPEVKRIFMDYSWEGNVRELKNVIESMVVSAKDKNILGMSELPEYFLTKIGMAEDHENETEVTVPEEETENLTYHELMERYEEHIIRKALQEANGNVSRAGEILDIPRETLRYRIKKLGI
ncbi:MAG: sigma 54-interacting transcriptional regulator [Firmicutes bacterium]|nr:sigma 54-interacting transcriptional regulator [Bacillota bacterium]